MKTLKFIAIPFSLGFAGMFLLAHLLSGCTPEAKYGSKLAACTELSNTKMEYESCCVGVAREQGRDPSFCILDDAEDASLVKSVKESLNDAGGDR